jgi:hydroxyethylthiazole kinase-like uncharacterized protein yjeF
MKIVTAAEMRAIDLATTEKHGVPSLTLMENAGTAVAEFARRHFDFSSVCVVCGKGNNGGDGFVAARHLREAGKKVSVIVLTGGPKGLKGDAASMFRKLGIRPQWVANEENFADPGIQKALRSDLIVDAILGTGFKPPLRELAQKAVEVINGLPSPVLAVDLPSGADADDPDSASSLHVHSDGIVTFTAPKAVHVFGDLTSGPVAVAGIGSPPEAVSVNSALKEDVITAADVQAIALPRPVDAHKGQFGHVLVIGGSVGKAGAAAMVGMAALRTGAGLVTVACPRSVQPTVAAFAPELMTVPLPETPEGTISLLALTQREELLKGKTAVVIGPGLSRNSETAEFVRDFVSVCYTSLVIDADGINAFEGRPEEIRKDAGDNSFRVITPHPGEMATLMGIFADDIQHGRINVARNAALSTGVCVVLKGHRTVVAGPRGHVWINPTGNPGMAKGGSGDVLAGIMGAVIARRFDGISGVKSVADPEGHKINILKQKQKQKYGAKDREAAKLLAEKMASKADEVLTLLATLNAGRAVYLHGLAGDIARELYGESSMIATDIIDCIADAMEACHKEAADSFAYLHR